MTTLRDAAQQALEALENERYVSRYSHITEAITALRAALAQPEPWNPDDMAYRPGGLSMMQAEPVAWGWRGADGQIRDCIAPDTHAEQEGEYTVPLYAHPAPAQAEQRGWLFQHITHLGVFEATDPAGRRWTIPEGDLANPMLASLLNAMTAALSAAALALPQAEPVALQDQTEMAEARRIAREYAWPNSNVDAGNLYWALHVCLRRIDAAAPAQAEPRKPLTDEEIARIYETPELAGSYFRTWTEKAIALARAIEAAHGIGDKE